MKHYHVDALPLLEPLPGLKGRMVHGETMTMAFWEIAEGAAFPEHDHPHEQIVHLLAGVLELTVSGETKRMAVGDAVVIPSGARHSARALEPCRVLDAFHPVREDYR